MTENGENLSREIVKPEFYPRGNLKFMGGNIYLRLYFSWCLLWDPSVNKRNRFCYYVQNKGFLILIFMFVDQLLLEDMFSQLHSLCSI